MNSSTRIVKSTVLACSAVLLLTVSALQATAQNSNDKPDLGTVTKIRQEGFRNTKVMEIMADLSDKLGQRLTGSPNQKRANEWARDMFTSWGLQNAHLEAFPFGRGWTTGGASVRMTAPDVAIIRNLYFALPVQNRPRS